jgi:hypothetical protein
MTFVAGQRVRASELNAGQPLIGYVTSDVTCISTTALIDVTGLLVAVEATATYAWDGYFAYNCGATPDIKFAFTIPSGATGNWGLYPLIQGSTGSSGSVEGFRLDGYGDANAQGAGGSDSLGGALMCMPRGYLVTTGAGTLQARFAQVNSTASNTVVKTGSWLRLTRIA